MQGRVILSKDDINTPKLTLTADELQLGTYTIRVFTSKGETLAKIVMQ